MRDLDAWLAPRLRALKLVRSSGSIFDVVRSRYYSMCSLQLLGFYHSYVFTSKLALSKINDVVAGIRGVCNMFITSNVGMLFGALSGVSTAVSRIFESFNAHGASIEVSNAQGVQGQRLEG